MTDAHSPIDFLDSLDASAWSALEQLSRAFRVKESDLQSTLDAVVSSSIKAIPEATFASINTLVRGRFVPQASVGEPPNKLDAFQITNGKGPCLVASATQAVIRIADTANEPRWPQYAELACQLGVRSMLCLPLWVDDQRLGSLSLYCPQPNGLTTTHEPLARLFAVFSSLALADAQRTDLRRSAENRDVIGQAKGILMERYSISADEAFAILSKSSQATNRKLLDVAESLARTGSPRNK